MYNFFQIGEEVILQGLSDLPLIVEGFNEITGGIVCKYFDENLQRYIRLTLPADSLIHRRSSPRQKKPPFLTCPSRLINDGGLVVGFRIGIPCEYAKQNLSLNKEPFYFFCIQGLCASRNHAIRILEKL